MKFEVGALLRGEVRRFLTKAKFLGKLDDWVEIKSFLTSEFILKNAVSDVKADLRDWFRRLERMR